MSPQRQLEQWKKACNRNNPDIDVCSNLLESGAGIDDQFLVGSVVSCAIHAAAYNGNVDMCNFLVSAGANAHLETAQQEGATVWKR